MQCDMCGAGRELVKAKIEGSVLDVCKHCARFGEIVRVPRSVSLHKKRPILKKKEDEKIAIIVPNYYTLIKNAREKMGLKQEDAAQKLAERESLYHKIETGRLKPSLGLAKKLERFFRIRLVEQYDDNMKAVIASAPVRKDAFTIGDMIKIKK